MRSVCLDIGTKTIKGIVEDKGGNPCIFNREHFSDPLKALQDIDDELLSDKIVALTGLVSGRYQNILCGDERFNPIDWTIPIIWYNNHHQLSIRYIIDIGATSLSLLEIKNGRFHRYQTNSLCASGTGSFLDQQMLRMNLDVQNIDNIKLTDRVPSIASRCAVFAKSDLIHRQQEGYTIDELWNGLVRGLAESCYATLMRGNALQGKILLIGGLIKNKLFIHYLSNLIDSQEILIPPDPQTYITLCGYKYLKSGEYIKKKDKREETRLVPSYEKKLIFQFNKDQDLTKRRYFDRYHNEINIDKHIENRQIPVFFGVDIGSTSTKGVLRDAVSGDILFSIYRKTAGNPVAAYQQLLKGIKDYQTYQNIQLKVVGMGTTGSGRRIVGTFAGADLIVNEITAHLKGALREYPEVRTIFEIGGQDSKYIKVEDNWMKDANMNYVCAAGTGSFLEEQAQILNISLDDFEKLSRGIRAPKMNDRCTVFMEMDAQKLIVDNYSKAEVVTSLLHAVCRNYLHRVVQNRSVEEPILFLGATARNRGLVEAFGNIIGKTILTSPHSHIMGALGMTELLDEQQVMKETFFKGWHQDEEEILFQERYCHKCHNRCRIIYFQSAGTTVSWGYMCGDEGKDIKTESETLNYFQKPLGQPVSKAGLSPNSTKITTPQEKIIYLPRALFYYSHGNFWKSFWSCLGFEVMTSPPSDREITNLGLNYSPNEICYPLKMAVGHAIHLINTKLTPLFIPYIIRDTPNHKATNSYFCVITQSFAAILKNTLQSNQLPVEDIITPVIDFSESDQYNVRQLSESISAVFPVTKKEIKKAFLFAQNSFNSSLQNLLLKGEEIGNILSFGNKPVLVIMGRSYNLYDEALNLALIKDSARYGFAMLPSDLIPARREDLDPKYENMYWSYGQKFLTLAKKLLSLPNFFPVFLTNFNCGPDSFLLSMLEDLWGDKPYLILELDEHSGNAGYLTRIEAFLDRIRTYHGKPLTPPRLKSNSVAEQVPLKSKKILFPPMHPFGTKLLAAAFRGYGYDALPLENEDQNTFQKGKACLRGSECLPAATTLGSFLDYYEKSDPGELNDSALFLPSASGPCRFGQYAPLQKMVLERLGINTAIFSLNSENNYREISGRLRLLIMKAIIITDLIIKLGCRLRPYVKDPAEIEKILGAYTDQIIKALESRDNPVTLLKSLNDKLFGYKSESEPDKPLVGIVGEIYVRSSPFSNAQLIEKIEKQGGEVWITPFMEWFHYTSWLKLQKESPLKEKITDRIIHNLVSSIEHGYYKLFTELLGNRLEPATAELINKALPYLSPAVRGEAILTIGRTVAFIEQGARLIINVAPFSCMPGTISSIVLNRISQDYSIPIISLYFDGFTSFDQQLRHYLNNL